MDDITRAKIRGNNQRECARLVRIVKAKGVNEAARFLGVNRSTLYRWAQSVERLKVLR